jgi:hypothetical protein
VSHDEKVALYERFFGPRTAYVTLDALAAFFSCSRRSIQRRFAPCLVTVPGGVRVRRRDVIAAIQ